MKKVMLFPIMALSINVFAVKETAVKESEITQCKKNSDCVIVPYSSCCGATKKAINKKFIDTYNKNKSWQKFDNPEICAVAGQCPSDKNVKETICEAGQCQLRFPN